MLMRLYLKRKQLDLNHMNSYPLMSDLGDRPDEWLELSGKGTSQLTAEQLDDFVCF